MHTANVILPPDTLKRLFEFCHHAYLEQNTSGQAFRQEGQVPYFVHPLWCAMMMVTDTRIPAEERRVGVQALFLHDILEDTNAALPEWVEPRVKRLVEQLTFESWEQALKEVPKKPIEVKLLILFDSLSSMYEEHVSLSKRPQWKQKVLDLLRDVDAHYGDLRIVQVGKAIAAGTDW